MKEREMKVAKKSASRISLYQSVFGSPEGQKVLADLMVTHHIANSTFDENPRKTILREGERNVVLRIMKILEMDVKAIQERIKSYENI